MALEENKDLAQKINDFLTANRKIVLVLFALVIIAVMGDGAKSELAGVRKIFLLPL